ncbi:MAG: hypothetical protein ABI345_04335, partial [Jatrophihabitans sp.]
MTTQPERRRRGGLGRFSARLTGAGVTALVALALFGVVLLLVITSWTPLHTLDHEVAKNLNSTVAPSPHAVDFWKAVSTIGQPLTFPAIAVLAGVLLWRKGCARLGLFVV